MSYQGLEPNTGSLSCDRMGSHEIRFTTTTWWGAAVNLTGYTLHLWLALPVPNAPIPVQATLVTPGGGYTITTTQVKFFITEADLSSWGGGLNPGTYPGELLASNDGGTTVDVVWAGNLIVNNGWLTDTF